MTADKKAYEAIKKLLSLYAVSSLNLLKTIGSTPKKGVTKKHYIESLQLATTGIIKNLTKESTAWVMQNIIPTYENAFKSSALEIGSMPITPYHVAAKKYAQAVADDLSMANIYVGNRINDVIRRMSLEAIKEGLHPANAQTVPMIQQKIVNELIKKGIPGIIDKNGRMLRLESYAGVVARSSVAECQNLAVINLVQSLGQDLVIMSSHASSCPVCAVLEGRVYSITGKDKRFPPLEMAYTNGYANIHPNCRHRLSPFIEEYNDIEKAISFSNKPFDMNEKVRQNIKAYQKGQAQKRSLYTDRRQWERYLLLLPDQTPSSFASFRKIKLSNSDKWERLESNYRFASRYLAKTTEELLPNFSNVIMDKEKFVKYFLSLESKEGSNKAIVFESALGYNISNYRKLESAIYAGLSKYKAVPTGDKGYGDKYTVRMIVKGSNGESVPIETAWIIKKGATHPRLVTAFVISKRKV